MPIVLVGDIIFSVLTFYYGKDYLVMEMKQTLLSFSRTVALDIARGYEVSNTRSVYSLLDELEHFDERIISLSVIDTNGTVTADIIEDRIFSRDTSSDVQYVLHQGREIVHFDEENKKGSTVVPIILSHQKSVVGAIKVEFSIQSLYTILDSLQKITLLLSVLVFLFLVTAILLVTRIIIIKPLRNFFLPLQRIQKGDFSLQIPVRNNDEINALAQHVNTMAAGLQEREFVKDTFSRYVPHEVVNQLLERKIHPRLEGELRNVTIFFSDIRGFTKLTERLRVEQIVYILNRYFSVMTEVVIQFDGIIDKFSGDEIMVVFGAPIHHDDDPFRAVKMGIEMSNRLKQLNVEFKKEAIEEIQIGIGINTGVAIAGNIGSEKRLNYSVIGDDVNLASRLVSHAKAGEIIISDATYEIVKSEFHCSTLGEVQVKGKSKPVQMYVVNEEIRL